MAQIYDNDINKYTDWGGDESTGGAPVSGRAVQKFIKDTLQDKIGYIYEDRDNNRCIGFADIGDYNLWISDPSTYASLIVQEWYCYFPPRPVVLDYPAYYGTVNNNIGISEAQTVVPSLLNNTTSTSAVCSSDKPYVYVSIYDGYNFIKAITINNEDILSEFVNIGSYTLNSKIYKLYEFHLSSGLPLDVNINIQFNKG